MNYSACDGGTIELLIAALFDQIYVSNLVGSGYPKMARCTPEALPSFDSGSSLQQLRSSWVPFDSSSFKSVTDLRTDGFTD